MNPNITQFGLINDFIGDQLKQHEAKYGKPAKPAAELKLAEVPMSTDEEREIQTAAKEGLYTNLERSVALIAICRAVDLLIDAGEAKSAELIWAQRDKIARSM
jgi:hypothetical protein